MNCFKCFSEAFIIGMALAMVVGPISVIFIKKTLSMGARGAFAVGTGVALGDTIYSIIAALSLSSVSSFLAEYDAIIKTLGGIFLLFLAYIEIKSDVKFTDNTIKSNSFLKIFTKAFLLTLSSPLTIGSFIAIFSSIGDENITIYESLAMAAGIMTSSIVWLIILGSILLRIKHKISNQWIVRLKYISATIIASFGLIAIFSF
jgi:threonine/homoserine/homoserine lactone efflux protein